MMINTGGTRLLVLLVCACLLSSCELVSDWGGDGASFPPLAETEWILVQLNGQDPMAETRITLEFDGDIAGGYAGCNWYGGTFTTNRPGALTLTDVASTERLCLEPEGVMDQENRYLDAFMQVREYRVVGDFLELRSADGENRLVYEPREELPLDPNDLIGTYWLLEARNGTAPPEHLQFTLSFQDGTAAVGYAGCRNFEATYEAEGDDLRFPTLTITEATADCTTEQWEHEGRFTTSLTETRHYRLNDSQLTLLTSGGEELTFARVLIR